MRHPWRVFEKVTKLLTPGFSKEGLEIGCNKHAETQHHSRHRILLVDDTRTSSCVVRLMLEKLGCQVDIAQNGRDALDAVSQNRYDLVLMDCRMPIIDGYEATRLIRAQESAAEHIPIIALTANTKIAVHKKCLKAGMDGSLHKPIRRKELYTEVARWTGIVLSDDDSIASQHSR